MIQKLDKLRQRFVCIAILGSVSLGLCLFIGQGLRISASLVDYLAASSESHFANSTPIESAVTSLERQVRIPGKGPRRQAIFGALPPCSTPDLSHIPPERSLAESSCEASITRAQPNDRAPPPRFS